MLRIVLAAAATLAMSAGLAGAQGLVPGAAAVEGYHERFAVVTPRDRVAAPTGVPVARAPLAAPGVQQTVVMSPVAAAIPGAVVLDAGHAPSPAGLTPGAPLGSDDFSDGKAVAGERR